MSSHYSFATHHIVLDPGHGGTDSGTMFQFLDFQIKEKEITLQLAQHIGQNLIEKGYRVTLTRKTDQFLPLQQRTHLANQLKADIFLSIHMNATLKTAQESSINPTGIETFVFQEPSLTPHPSHELAFILKDLQLNAQRIQSTQLACQIQKNLVLTTAILDPMTSKMRKNRGIKEALFQVLHGAHMPSALVEVGFLSHPQDRSRVLSPRGQLKISQAITQGIEDFFQAHTCSLNGLEL